MTEIKIEAGEKGIMVSAQRTNANEMEVFLEEIVYKSIHTALEMIAKENGVKFGSVELVVDGKKKEKQNAKDEQ